MLEKAQHHGLELGVGGVSHESTRGRTQCRWELGQRAHEVDPDARQERRHVEGELRRPGGEFADVRIVEIDRAQLFESRARAVEHFDHLVGCNPRGQGC